LWRTNHVLGGSQEFYNTLGEFGTLKSIPPETLVVQMAKVRRGSVVELATDITTPATTVFLPIDKGINVGSTSLTTNDTGTSRLDRVYFFIVFSTGG